MPARREPVPRRGARPGTQGRAGPPPAVPDAEGDANDFNPREQYRQLMLQVLAAERARLLAARSAGTYTSRTLTGAQRAMDLMEATLQQIPDLAEPG
jgi:hypothetical protein